MSYGYAQIQKANMEFFMAVGMGMFSHTPAPKNTDFTVVISGDVCTPCKALMPLVDPVTDLTTQPQLSAAWSGQARVSACSSHAISCIAKVHAPRQAAAVQRSLHLLSL